MKKLKKYWYIIAIILILFISCLIFGLEFEKSKVDISNKNGMPDSGNNIDILNNKNGNPQEKEIKPKSYSAYVPIYMYHWLKEDTGGYEYPEMMVKPSELRKQFEYISQNNYDAIFITDLENVYKYDKPIALTFDDGWQDVYLHAFPLVKEFNIKISMYIINDFVGTPGYCTLDELKEMKESGLVQIDAHTVTHRKLATLSKEEVYNELLGSKNYLKDNLGIDAKVICYPSGSFNLSVINIANELGYKFGLAMDGGVHLTSKYSNMEIPRIFATRSMSINTFANYANKSSVKVEW